MGVGERVGWKGFWGWKTTTLPCRPEWYFSSMNFFFIRIVLTEDKRVVWRDAKSWAKPTRFIFAPRHQTCSTLFTLAVFLQHWEETPSYQGISVWGPSSCSCCFQLENHQGSRCHTAPEWTGLECLRREMSQLIVIFLDIFFIKLSGKEKKVFTEKK